MMYSDPDGELAFLAIVGIAAAIFGTGNTVAHAIRGDIGNIGDVFRYFAQGAIAGAVIGAAVQVPVLGTIMQGAGLIQGGATGLSVASGLIRGITTGNWNTLGNAGKLFLGNFYLDENRSFYNGIFQGISRHTWELPQTTLGGTYSQLRNMAGKIDHVEYFGGATFAINENTNDRWGISLGNYININLLGELDRDFEGGWMNSEDGLFWHEYGHTFQSERFGFSYLFALGIPSASGADWSETSANRWAWRYANHYNFMEQWLYPIERPLH